VTLKDTHHHHHDPRAVTALLEVVRGVKPDEVCILGDFIDCKAPARWSKGSADEFAADLLEEAAAGQQTLKLLREAQGDRSITFIAGNHDTRIRNYVLSTAPALKGIVRDYPELLDFEGYGVVEKKQPYRVAPGVAAIHGNKLSSTQNAAGQSAFKERMRHGVSIVQGHTHRLGIGWDSQEKDRFWLECGHLKDIRKAHYLDYESVANWQQGFGALRIDGQRVFPTAQKITRGVTFFDGKRYTA
jgi:UDP-2,3-diacylglucosamine pyrophosphatase LpxH